jgi:chemotaxis protein histidine kinase CheA
MASDDLGSELEAFNAEYRRSVPERLREIDGVWTALRQGDVSPERMRSLLRALHSMAGSGTTFGMPALSETAAAAEDWIQPFCERAAMPDEAGCREFDGLLQAVRQAGSAP